jgi:hypothetical protein
MKETALIIRRVPETLRRELKVKAAREGKSMRRILSIRDGPTRSASTFPSAIHE